MDRFVYAYLTLMKYFNKLISNLVFLQCGIYHVLGMHVLGMPDSGVTLLPRMSIVAYILPRVSPG